MTWRAISAMPYHVGGLPPELVEVVRALLCASLRRVPRRLLRLRALAWVARALIACGGTFLDNAEADGDGVPTTSIAGPNSCATKGGARSRAAARAPPSRGRGRGGDTRRRGRRRRHLASRALLWTQLEARADDSRLGATSSESAMCHTYLVGRVSRVERSVMQLNTSSARALPNALSPRVHPARRLSRLRVDVAGGSTSLR